MATATSKHRYTGAEFGRVQRGFLAVGRRRISRRTNHGVAGNHGLIDLLQRTVVVLNDSDGRADKRTRTILVQQFADHGLVVIEVPFDPHLRRGGVIDVAHDMSSKTPRRFYEITVATADHFNSTTQRLGEQRSRDPMRVSAMIPDRGPTALQQVHPAQPEWNPSLEIRRPWKVLRTVTSAAVEGY